MGAVFDRTLALLLLLAAALVYLAYQKSGAFPWGAAERAGGYFLGILPKLVAGLLIGAILTEILPKSFIENWLSDRSGLQGIAFGWLAGALFPMGAPFVLFPMAAGLLKGGAGVGPIVTMLTASALLGPFRIIVFEVPIMGGGFFLSRVLSVFWVPPLAGLISQSIAQRLL